jgi:hypothetical protein
MIDTSGHSGACMQGFDRYERATMKQALQRIATITISALFATSAVAQQVVYPAKGQSKQQQQKDEAECHQWAVQNTGVDPTKPTQQAAAPAPATTPTGTTPGAGARGAARGAGAMAGRAQSRRQNAAQQQQASQQQQQTQSSQNATYAKARGACLEGRGYTVK